MRTILFLVSAIAFFQAQAGDKKYPVSEIPEELKKDVNAVVRHKAVNYTIHSRGKATYTVHQVITILNPNGKNFARETLNYSKSEKISYFRGAVYDQNGELVKKMKTSEVIDRSAFDGFSLFTDNRYKSVDLSVSEYPYTVEFDYEIDFNYLYLHYDDIIPDEKVSVQKIDYLLKYPQEVPARYILMGIKAEPKKSQQDGSTVLTWEFTNLGPIKVEELSDDDMPSIRIAPTEFEYAGYAGNMTTWDKYAKWKADLLKDRDILSPVTTQKVLELTKNLKTKEEKAKVLYEYLQGKTRYVSIQLGIGGLQPFPASVVDDVGYGDCKALSNYMVAMLKVAGIKGYYCAVKAGKGELEIKEDFPSHQSNHIIVAVPNDRDTIWLECTSQSNPFGYIGTFTGDRKALLVNENGGALVKTTHYSAEQNVQARSVDTWVKITGDAEAMIKTSYRGTQYENRGLDNVLHLHADDQKKWIQNSTEIASFDVMSFSMQDHRGRIPEAVVDIKLALRRMASVNGKRMFITPNLMNRWTYIPEKLDARKSEIVWKDPFIDMDTIHYHLPEGIYPEFVPEPIVLKSKFGEYEAKFVLDQNNITYIRRLKMNKGKFPAASYKEFSDFLRAISKADNTKMVFLNKT